MNSFQSVFFYLEKGLTDDGTTMSRFQVLFRLYFDGEMNAADLSRQLLVTRGNMSMFLRRMESDKLIKFRIPMGKKRPVVHLSSRGIKLFEIVFPRHIKRLQNVLRPFTNQTKMDLESLKGRVDKSIG